MWANIAQALGGLGLFLLGMVVMTDGLRGIAGAWLQRTLAQFTRSPFSGAITGAVSTAILQSSSATTVAAVGFVSAGLLTFAQALGIIFGANLGTTVTGWLVAVLGLKLKIGDITTPLILLGVMLRLFGRGRLPAVGLAVAGFGLIFVGIGSLQSGMSALQGVITPADFPGDSLGGRLSLVLLGMALTLITQSSSAGVAAALTAVYTGAISFPQAAAMVIGMDVGTTVTAALATLGGSVATRRTGYSHVIYNLITAVGALLLLTPYVWAWEWLQAGALKANAELALVGFHSLFNLLGVLLVLPFASGFARLVERLVPAKADALVEGLDRQLLGEPSVALDAAHLALRREFANALEIAARLITRSPPDLSMEVEHMRQRVNRAHAFVDGIHLGSSDEPAWHRLIAAVHALDHFQRLLDRIQEEPDRAFDLARSRLLRAAAEQFTSALDGAAQQLAAGEDGLALLSLESLSHQASADGDTRREQVMSAVARDELDVPAGTDLLEALRWMRRVSAHLARISRHLNEIPRPQVLS